MDGRLKTRGIALLFFSLFLFSFFSFIFSGKKRCYRDAIELFVIPPSCPERSTFLCLHNNKTVVYYSFERATITDRGGGERKEKRKRKNQVALADRG